MTTDTATPAEIAPTAQHGRLGSTARLAVLQHLARFPDGEDHTALLHVLRIATGEALTPRRVTQVLMSLHADKLIERERRDGDWLWFSPHARRAAAERGSRRPAAALPQPTHQGPITMLALRSGPVAPPDDPTTPPLNWCATHHGEADAEALPSHMRPGAAVRLAMLLHLAQAPDGVPQATLGLIAAGACSPRQAVPSDAQMRVICGHMATLGQLGVETGRDGQPRYFSPPARKAHRVRRLHGYTLPARIQPAQVTEVAE